MSKNVLTLQPHDRVSKFIALMERHHIHEAPIVSDGKLVGLVHYKNIAEKGIIDPTSIKLENVMTKPPVLSPDDSVETAAETIFSTAYRAIPVVSNNSLVGIISVFDIISFLARTEEFRQSVAESIMSTAEIINEREDIGKARVLMREKNISRLPVVDDYGKLVGVATIFDLLKVLKRRERMGWYSMAAEKLTTMNIPVSVVMNKNPLTITKNTALNKIVEMFKKHKTVGAIVCEKDVPIGIVTMRDLLEFYLARKKKKGVYVQITGLKDEDEFVLSTVDRMIRDTVKKLSSVYSIQFLFLHVKKYRKQESEKIKYSVRCRLMIDIGVFISRAFAWDVRDAIDNALDSLERAVLKEKAIRKRSRKFKRFLKE